MGILNIIKNSQEPPSSDSFSETGPFLEDTETPLVVDIYSDASDTESYSELHDADDLLNIISYSNTDGSDDESNALNPPSSPVINSEMGSQGARESPDDTITYRLKSQTSTVNKNKRVHATKDLSNKSCRSTMGKKKARRFENARQLALLAAEDYNEIDMNDFMPFNCPFRFSQILEDADLTNKILNSTLEDIDEFISSNLDEEDSKKMKIDAPTMQRLSPAEAFNNLDPSQKSFFKRRNLPMGMIQYLDMSVFSFFENNPTGTYISEPLTSFQRMMLHSIAHYYELNSYSFDAEDHPERLTKVTNSFNYFKPPCLCLSQYIEDHLWKNFNSATQKIAGPASKRRRCKRKQL